MNYSAIELPSINSQELDNTEEETPSEPTPSPAPGNNQNETSANTGDSSDAGIYAGILTVSAILSLILIYERRKRASD